MMNKSCLIHESTWHVGIKWWRFMRKIVYSDWSINCHPTTCFCWLLPWSSLKALNGPEHFWAIQIRTFKLPQRGLLFSPSLNSYLQFRVSYVGSSTMLLRFIIFLGAIPCHVMASRILCAKVRKLRQATSNAIGLPLQNLARKIETSITVYLWNILSHTIHVWYIYLHLIVFYSKCSMDPMGMPKLFCSCL